MDNYACDTGFQFYGYDNHIYSIHQQETEIHLETHACQSLHLLLRQLRILSQACNSGILSILTATIATFIQFYSKPSERLDRLHSISACRNSDSRGEACHGDMAFGRGE